MVSLKRLSLLFITFFYVGVATNLGAMVVDDDSAMQVEPAVDHTLVAKLAETDGFGYKAAHLMYLQQRFPDVAIPEFVGMQDVQGKVFLEKQGMSLTQQWPLAAAVQTDDVFITEAGMLAQKIQALEAANSVQVSRSLMPRHVVDFIHRAKQNGWRLMVRSTGKEDSETCSNAGGNHTEINVNPEESAVVRAANKVIASYLQAKSLAQRQGAGENVRALPFTPVLIQRMIGEPLNGAMDIRDIPVGCVVYTQEPFGNTPGVVLIQAAFGHNQGVVDCSVAIDTFLVDQANRVHRVVKTKPTRFVPTQDEHGYGLRLMPNPEALQHQPALDDATAIKIKDIATRMHEHFGKTMDLEMVYDRREDNVYLVQARPLAIVSNQNPSYVRDVPGDAALVAGITVVNPDDNAVKVINDKTQIMSTATLAQALNEFNRLSPEQMHAVKVVVVEREAESTSHAAAVFRGAHVVIVMTQEREKIQGWLTEEPLALSVDVQKGVMVKGTPAIVAGWFKHPLPQKVSIPHAPTGVVWDTTSDIYNRCHYLAATLSAGHPVRQKLINLCSYAQTIEAMLRPLAGRPADDMTRLFYENILNALRYQVSMTGLEDAYSLASLEQELAESERFKAHLQTDCGFMKNQVDLLASHADVWAFAQEACADALTPELERSVLAWLSAAVTNQESIKRLLPLLRIVKRLDVLPLFINFYCKRTRACAAESKASFEFGSNLGVLEQVQQKRLQLESFDLAVWEKPEEFEKQFERFGQHYAAFFTNELFQNIFTNSSRAPLCASIALSAMENFVDVFDQSIKRLKGSTLYPEDGCLRVANEKRMLVLYLIILQSWLTLPWVLIDYHVAWPRDTYMGKIGEILNGLPDNAAQLNPSAGFSVANAALGSTTAFDRNLPRTAEDVFTLIHQNLLIVLGSITNGIVAPALDFPSLFRTLNALMIGQQKIHPFDGPQGIYRTIGATLLSVSCKKNQLLARYNLRLDNHSAVFDVVYDKATDSITVTIRFVGQRRTRWDLIQAQALFDEQFKVTPVLQLKGTVLDENEVTLTYMCRNGAQLELLAQIIVLFVEFADQLRDSLYFSSNFQLFPDFFARYQALAASVPQNIILRSRNVPRSLLVFYGQKQETSADAFIDAYRQFKLAYPYYHSPLVARGLDDDVLENWIRDYTHRQDVSVDQFIHAYARLRAAEPRIDFSWTPRAWFWRYLYSQNDPERFIDSFIDAYKRLKVAIPNFIADDVLCDWFAYLSSRVGARFTPDEFLTVYRRLKEVAPSFARKFTLDHPGWIGAAIK